MKKLLIFAALLGGSLQAHATACNIPSGASVATINAAIQAARSAGCTGTASSTTVALAAGSYSVTSQIIFPCTSGTNAVTLTGPIVAWPGPYTAVLNGPVSGNVGMDMTCNGVTIQYLEWNGNRPNTVSPPPTNTASGLGGGGGFLSVEPGVSNWNIEYNYLHGIQASTGGEYNDTMITMYGTDTSDPNYKTDSNVDIGWNQFGPNSLSAAASSPDCSNGIYVYNFNGTNYDASGGFCLGVNVSVSTNNFNFHNNRVWGVIQAIHQDTGSSSGNNYYVYLENNFQELYNDFQYTHRNTTELQGRGQGTTGFLVQYNDVMNDTMPGYATMGYSLPSCCSTSTNGPLFSPPFYTTCDDNLALSNTPPPSGEYSPEAFEWSGDSHCNHNLIQGAWTAGITWGYTNSSYNYAANYNVIQMTKATAYIPQEFPGNTFAPQQVGNVEGQILSALTSAAPTISPAPSTISSATSVTLTDNGLTGNTPGPRANTGIFYTTDGSTPTTASTFCYQTCTFSISPGTVVKAIGMWGAQNQPTGYPTGYGFVPSAVQSWNYASSGSTPTLTAVTLTFQDGTSTLMVGNSKQACANGTYSDSITLQVCGAGSDARGTTPNSWTSSNPSNASISNSGSVAGLVGGGSTNLTVKAGSLTSPAFPLTVTAAAPSLTAVAPICAPSVAQSQSTTCTAQCTFTPGGPTACTSPSFTSSTPSVATINASTGVLTGVAVGSTVVTASQGGFSGTTNVTVTSSAPPAATLTGVSIACNPTSALVGATTSCTATCLYSDSTTTNCSSADAHGNDATFASSATGVATITSAGLATGVSAGNTNITASVGGFTSSPAFSVTITPVPATNLFGDNLFNVVGGTSQNYQNSQYFVIPSGTISTVSACSFYLPTGTTYTAGSKWDCMLTLAPTPTTQSSSVLCPSTYTTLGTSADVGWHTLSMPGCGTVGSATVATGYRIGVVTNETNSPGQGFSNCGGVSCTGSAPTSGIGTYPCQYISQVYGAYTGNGTTLTNVCGVASGVQMSAYVTLTTPLPTLTGGYLITPAQSSGLQVGKTVQVLVAACYSDSNCYLTPTQYGDTVTSFTSSAPSVVMIGAVGSATPGLATATAVGTASIQAVISSVKSTSLFVFNTTVSAVPLPLVSPRALVPR